MDYTRELNHSALDAVLMWERDQAAEAAGYILASVALSIVGLFIGLMIVRRVL
jgi:fluoride ion exporter CrcB/FEX